MYIGMAVDCIGKECKNCPELDVNTRTEELYSNEGVVGIENTLSCANYAKCKIIKKHLESEKVEQEELKKLAEDNKPEPKPKTTRSRAKVTKTTKKEEKKNA